jgi:hypothetical protein
MKKLLIGLVAVALAAVSSAQFEILAAESAPGPGNQNPSTWGGVLRFGIDIGGNATALSGIDKTLLADPVGVVFAPDGELMVSNRHGNTQASSVGRFLRDGSGNYVANGAITGNSLFGAHGANFNPVTGEFWVTNVNGPLSRFTGGSYTANGTVSSGPVRDINFNADGSFAYVTTSTGTLRRLNTATLTFTDFGVSATGLHQMQWRGGALYGANYASGGTGGVYTINLDGAGAVTGVTQVVSLSDAIGVTFSPDGNEMFVSRHGVGGINRYLFNSGSWVANGSISTTNSLGHLATYAVPEPASLLALAGLVPLVLRRRRK